MTAKHKFVMSNILSSSSAEFLNRKKERSYKGLSNFWYCVENLQSSKLEVLCRTFNPVYN